MSRMSCMPSSPQSSRRPMKGEIKVAPAFAAIIACTAEKQSVTFTIKIPMTWDGMKAVRALRDQGLMVNVTLCFSAVQAMMAAKAGATFISPFIGRLDDCGEDGMQLIRDIRQIYDNYGFKTEILAASIRSVSHVRESALAGADVATLPPNIFKQLIN